jgi:hypothetical protein
MLFDSNLSRAAQRVLIYKNDNEKQFYKGQYTYDSLIDYLHEQFADPDLVETTIAKL